MKRFVLGSLSVLMLSAAIAPAAKAENLSVNPQTTGVTSPFASQTTPFNLAHLAYRGYFKAQGIPSYGILLNAYRSGKIDAKDVAMGAVEAGRISSEVLNDRGYLHALELQLDSFLDTGEG
jgi:hypothetical protein